MLVSFVLFPSGRNIVIFNLGMTYIDIYHIFSFVIGEDRI